MNAPSGRNESKVIVVRLGRKPTDSAGPAAGDALPIRARVKKSRVASPARDVLICRVPPTPDGLVASRGPWRWTESRCHSRTGLTQG